MKNNKLKLIVAVIAVLPLLAWSNLALAWEGTGTLCTGLCPTTVDGTVIVSPTASPVAGTYTSTQSVALTANGSLSIHYTTNGDAPTCSTGTAYVGAISVGSSQTIKAISCYQNNQFFSSVATFAYAIGSNTISSVNSISDINVANGTTLANIGLPTTVNIGFTLTCSGGNNVGGGGGGCGGAGTGPASITWDGGTPIYNGSTAGTYTFIGTLTLPSGVTNPNGLTARVNVVVATASTPVVSSGGGGGGSYTPPATNNVWNYTNVGILDFSILMSEWGQTGVGLSADLTHDGTVDILDFSMLMADWNGQ